MKNTMTQASRIIRFAFFAWWLAYVSNDNSKHRVIVAGQSTSMVVISNDNRLSQFKEMMKNADVSPGLGKTVFGPTNDAFEKFRDSDPVRWDKWMTQPEFFVHFRDMVEWHFVTEGNYTRNQIFDGARERMENLQGNITINQQFKQIDNVREEDFLESDIDSADGIIHVVDQVLVPPFLETDMISQLLESRQEKFSFSNMANLALHVGLDDRINAAYDNGFTFLVPPNRRFNRAEINVPHMLQPGMFNYTRDFVLCHMIRGNYHEAQIFAMNEASGEDQMLVTSELGTHMWITSTEDHVRFQSQKLLLADQPSDNGIFQVLDYPLFPPTITDFAFFTPMSTNIDTGDCFRFFRECKLSSDDIADMFNTTLTVFCPTREAFTFFNYEDFNRLLSPDWYRHACEFLMNHIMLGAMTREELVAESPRQIQMLNGAVYNLRKSGDRPRIQNGNEEGRSNFGDLIALDGYLHTIDSAITPTAVSHSIYDKIQFNPETTLYKKNIDFVDLTDLYARDSPLTVLAPDNTAFRRVEFDTISGGPILKRHVFRGLLFCDVLANETEVSTVDGVVLGVEVKDDELWVGGAKVYECDTLAHNGVVHLVDRVIGLTYDSPSPTHSPAPTVTPEPSMSRAPSQGPQALFTQLPDNGAVPIYLPPVEPPINILQAPPTHPPHVIDSAAPRNTASKIIAAATGAVLLCLLTCS